MQAALYYRLPECDPNRARRIIKVIRAIVAGHERAEGFFADDAALACRATIRRGLVRLTLAPQVAEAADFWVRAAYNNYHPETEPNLRIVNTLTLIWKCGAILVPQGGPNGGYETRNGGRKSVESICVPKASSKNMRIE